MHGDLSWLAGPNAVVPLPQSTIVGGVTSEDEEEQLEALNIWVEQQGLPRGELAYDFADSETGSQKAIFDLAWPVGLQAELSQPVAVLLNGARETVSMASQAGFRCFTDLSKFKAYVLADLLAMDAAS